MASEEIVDVLNLDLSKVTFGEPRAINSGKGARTCSLLYEGKRLIIQTPSSRLPFGLQQSYGSSPENPKYVMELSLQDEKFMQKMKELDEFMIAQAVKNGGVWLREEGVTEEWVRRLYTPNVKYSKDPTTNKPTDKYPPTMKLKVPYRNEQFVMNVYDEGRQEVEKDTYLEVLGKGARVETLTSCLGVWLIAGKFGLSWKVEQAKYSNVQKLKGYAFLDKDEALLSSANEIESNSVHFTVDT